MDSTTRFFGLGFLALLSLFICLVITGRIPLRTLQQIHIRQPEIITKNYALLPTQTLTVTNSRFRVMEIRSEYPISISYGSCHADYTVDWRCIDTSPHDLFARDIRRMPIFSAPRANSISITWEEFSGDN